MPCGVQNIDSRRLVAKILRNKGLETPIGRLGPEVVMRDWCRVALDRYAQSYCGLSISSVKVVRHKDCGIFLWRAVEK